MRYFIEDKGKDIALKLSNGEDSVLSVSALISGKEVLSEDAEEIIFVFPSENGNVTPSLQHYLETLFVSRDNTKLKYVAAVITNGKNGLALYIMEVLLYNAGVALPYSVVLGRKKSLDEIKEDLNKEEIKIQGRVLLSHFISRFKLRANRRRYQNNEL